MKHRALIGSFLTASLLGGCGNIPASDYFDRAGGTAAPGPNVHVDDLVSHIECELVQSKNLDALLGNDPGGSTSFVAQISLTLKVEDNGGLSPSLSYIDPLGGSASFVYGLNGNLNVNRIRTFTASYWINLKALRKRVTPASCAARAGDRSLLPNLSGDLGIDGIIAGGLAARDGHEDKYAPNPSSKDNVNVFPSFGSTVQFTLTRAFDTGPTWSLTNFKGPGGSKGLVNGGRTDTDQMIIAFSASTQKPGLAGAGAGEAERATNDAAAAAQTFTTNILLQNLSGLLPH